PPAQSPPRRLEAHAVVPARVGLVAHHTVHPVVGRDARPREHHAVDLARAQAGIAQEGIDGPTRIARVVLQPGKSLLGRAADDLAIAQYRRGRAVRLTDPQNDQDPTIIAAMVTSL